jgi:exodeoxyribonuclease VII small subunit
MAKFEEDLTKLEGVVERLERGELTLDESVRLFEEGVRLSAACKKELEQAEGRIQVLVEGKSGRMQVAEMDLDKEDSDGKGIEDGEDEE